MTSRVRVAPGGRVAAATSFVAGDYYNVDSFSTRTVFLDLNQGKVITDLERFDIRRGGHEFHPIDMNFWGVTFAADSDTFYATMRTGSHHFLIKGRLSTRRAEVLRDHVECPGLSPDGRLIAYKSRIDHGFDPATWQLRVLDVVTLADRPLAETRDVDDQVTWLDDTHVLYGIPDGKPYSSGVDTWMVNVDGSGPPQLLVGSRSRQWFCGSASVVGRRDSRTRRPREGRPAETPKSVSHWSSQAVVARSLSSGEVQPGSAGSQDPARNRGRPRSDADDDGYMKSS